VWRAVNCGVQVRRCGGGLRRGAGHKVLRLRAPYPTEQSRAQAHGKTKTKTKTKGHQ
jgi:hypothetical protein